MLPNTRLTLLAIAAVLALQFPSARAGAQSPPKTPVSTTVDEEITIDVPFTLHKLAAEIVSISATCSIWEQLRESGDIPISTKWSASKPVSTVPKAADGSISGTLTTVHVFKRGVNLTGTTGTYICDVWGTTLAGPRDRFNIYSSNPLFKVTGRNETGGGLTW